MERRWAFATNTEIRRLTNAEVTSLSTFAVIETAVNCGQDLNYRLPYLGKGTKTRSRDATLSRYSGVDIAQLQLQIKISDGPTGEVRCLLVSLFHLWRDTWQGNEIVARILNLREVTPRKSRDFQEEYPRLRLK
ncbi:integrin-linked protein kinase [Trichinella spiralis]|uniref:integrin-linked protein kinase n=1 Tax=Trichinella spiralis TaxID=6334 RepID=UPI0001EFE678|nr:integrin-linked protein kinase [Trichinella spiralis]